MGSTAPELEAIEAETWYEALEYFLRFDKLGKKISISGATVHQTPIPGNVSAVQVGKWLIEKKQVSRVRFALHLYPTRYTSS